MNAFLLVAPTMFSLVVLLLTWPAVESLAFRRAAFWHLAEIPRTGPPVVPASQRPMENPELGPFLHPHVMYLDRRPQRERLLPTYLAPSIPPGIPSVAITAWGGASALLAAGAAVTFTVFSRVLPGVLMGCWAAGFAAITVRGMLHNGRLDPLAPVVDKLVQRASAALSQAQRLVERGESASARALLRETADTMYDLAPGSGDADRVLGLVQEIRAAEEAMI